MTLTIEKVMYGWTWEVREDWPSWTGSGAMIPHTLRWSWRPTRRMARAHAERWLRRYRRMETTTDEVVRL